MYIIPFGKSSIKFSVPENLEVDVILPHPTTAKTNILEHLERCFANPLDELDMHSLNTKSRIGIAINDTTRPVPNSVLIPPLLQYLEQKGAQRKNIVFFIATGTHKHVRKEHFFQLLPAWLINEYEIIIHDCDDQENLVFLGRTSRDTPVYINKRFFQMNAKIVIGNIEPHHYMGYSGGAKSAAIGLAGRETIDKNHSLLMDPLSFIGNYASNPTRQDMEEIGDKIGITAALNVILNSEKEIVSAFWGSPRSVMQAGIETSKQVCQKKIEKKYDLIIASPGGYPKDVNFYQAQKAITHVNLIAEKQGSIILAAECREGLGNQQFENYLMNFSSFSDVVTHFKKVKFEVGPHKAYQLALQAIQNRIILVSDIQSTIVKKTMLESFSTIQPAINEVFHSTSNISRVAIVPYSTNTVLY